ncbi:unnamed protein product, partial [Closterium sp. NIES-53]
MGHENCEGKQARQGKRSEEKWSEKIRNCEKKKKKKKKRKKKKRKKKKKNIYSKACNKRNIFLTVNLNLSLFPSLASASTAAPPPPGPDRSNPRS